MSACKSCSRGGRRVGAGRHPTGTKRVEVRLSPSDWIKFKNLGGSKWLREQLEMLQSEQTAEKSGVM